MHFIATVPVLLALTALSRCSPVNVILDTNMPVVDTVKDLNSSWVDLNPKVAGLSGEGIWVMAPDQWSYYRWAMEHQTAFDVEVYLEYFVQGDQNVTVRSYTDVDAPACQLGQLKGQSDWAVGDLLVADTNVTIEAEFGPSSFALFRVILVSDSASITHDKRCIPMPY